MTPVVDPDLVWLGSDAQIDAGTVLGYRPGRSMEDYGLTIGERAVIRHGTIIYAGSTIGDRLETGHGVVIREENRIGDGFRIWNHSVIDYGCRIGSNVRVHNHVYVAQYTTIEDGVFLAPGVMIANDPHPVCTLCMRGPTIRRGARIGVNVTLMPHVVVGEHALIGAGSVVTRDIPARAVAYGNPARVQGSVDELDCPFEIVDRPYQGGVDVETRLRLGQDVHRQGGRERQERLRAEWEAR